MIYELRERLARDITRIMVRRGISQSELARSMNTGRATVHRILHPDIEGGLTLDTLVRLASALKLQASIHFSAQHRKPGRPRKPARLYRWAHWGKSVKARSI
jgi:transcriptional regulator with XRE-family HTH domain